MIVALSDFSVVAWWATLAVGLVVALVVWALLEALRRSVTDVKDRVDAVLRAGGAVAQNTQAAHLLESTKARGGDVLAALEQRGGER